MAGPVKTIHDFIKRRRQLEQQIVSEARHVIPALKDAQMPNMAAKLEELYFQYDAKDQAMKDAITANPEIMVEGLLKGLERSLKIEQELDRE